jgi:small subunit ribosomal protein S16
VPVKIRLLRVGKAKQPSYRVVVADSRSPRDGRIIETIGHYGPRAEPSTVDINTDRALAWLRQGAQPTEQVQKLLTTMGIWSTFESEKGHPIVTKLNRRGFKTGKVAAPTKAPTPATAAPKPAEPASKDTTPTDTEAAPKPAEPASKDTTPTDTEAAPKPAEPASKDTTPTDTEAAPKPAEPASKDTTPTDTEAAPAPATASTPDAAPDAPAGAGDSEETAS